MCLVESIKNHTAFNIMKKIELFLILVVAIFMSLTLPIFNKDHVMDFGSTTDWISALSTLGTLIIAYAAFKHAPKWLNQKMDEHAFNIAKDLIVKDFPQIQSVLNEYVLYMYTFIAKDDEVDTDASLPYLYEFINKKNSLLNTFKLTSKKINSDILSLQKLGWNLNDTRYNLYLDLSKGHMDLIQKLDNLHRGFDTLSSDITNINPEDYLFKKKIVRLRTRCNSFIELHKLYYENYFVFIDSASTVPEYFDINKISIQ